MTLSVGLFLHPLTHWASRAIKVFAMAVSASSVCGAFGSELSSHGLTFFHGFERSRADADFAKGLPDKHGTGLESTVGIVGGGAGSMPDGASFSELGNFDFSKGTLSLWVRPLNLRGQTALFKTTNFEIRLDSNARKLFFMTGANRDDGSFEWDYSVFAPLQAIPNDHWTHLAVTWNSESGEKEIYLDGERVVRGITALFPRRRVDTRAHILFASGEKGSLDLDEAGIWNRVLSSEEILALAKKADSLAQLAMKERQFAELPHSLLEVGLESTSPDRTIITPGNSFPFVFWVSNHGQKPISTTLRIRLLDFFGKDAAEPVNRELSIAAGDAVRVEVSFVLPRQGIFKIQVSAPNLGGPWEPSSAVAWPDLPRLGVDSFFGLHVHSWDSRHLAQAARLGFRWNRNHNMLQTTWWPRVQPEPGPFTWLHNSSLDRNLRHGFEVLGQFFGTPYWAARRGSFQAQLVNEGDGPYPYGAVPKLDAFGKYVEATVRQYKNRIRFWEIWNEPDVSMFWNGTPQEFAEMAAVAYRRAKAADPSATVLVGGFSTGFPWIEEAASAGALRSADGIGFHFYHSPNENPDRLASRIARIVSFYRELCAKVGVSPNLPLWHTEGGSISTTWLSGLHVEGWPPAHLLPAIDATEAAMIQVIHDVLLLSHGVRHSFSYLWKPHKQFSDLSEMDINGAPKPKMVARAVLAYQIKDLSFASLINSEKDGFRAAVFANSSASVAVCWMGSGGRLTIRREDLPPGTTAMNLMGNEIDAEEICVGPEVIYFSSRASGKDFASQLVSLPRRVEAFEKMAATEDARLELPTDPFPSALEASVEKFFSIDLRGHANMGFADETAGDGKGGWTDQGSFNSLSSMPTGAVTIGGVRFSIIDPTSNDGRSVLVLKGQGSTPSHPESIKDIPVERAVRSLYLLMAAAWCPKDGEIARLDVHYTDGTTASIPVEAGKHLADWWLTPPATVSSRVLQLKEKPSSLDDSGLRYLHAFEWPNPHPNKVIRSIDFSSTHEMSTAILVAITGLSW